MNISLFNYTDSTESEVPPCFCLSGGICQDRACVCPEEWVGSLCQYKPGNNTSIAIRMCSRQVKIPTLEPPKILNCDENLDSLASQVETMNISSVAASNNTEILTSMPDQLTQNIYAPASITMQILKTPNVSEDSQGYKHSPTIAHNALAKILAEIPVPPGNAVYQYIDDILIGGENRESLYVMWMLASLCFSVLIFNIIFISGIESNTRNHSDSTTSHYQQYLPYDTISNTLLTSDLVDPPSDSWCTAVAVLLYYFLLATFMWSALSSAQLYFLLLRAMKPLPEHFLITMSVIGWVIPAVVVAITLGATYREGKALNYRKTGRIVSLTTFQLYYNMYFKALYQLFLLPVALILLFNIITFIIMSVSVIWKERSNNFLMYVSRNKKDSFMKKMIGTISIVAVLGITWTIGYFMLISHEETSLFFSYLFCIFNATQGLQICILYTFRSPAFKNKVSSCFLLFGCQGPVEHVYLAYAL
ncbi:LOW QUALITY PROTEIN: adhesion G-protein coupled receptor G7 [Amazona ochrocephala]